METRLKNISDKNKYPGIYIYQSGLIKSGTAITLPGIGIIVSTTYHDQELEKVIQHEYGHFLDANHGNIGGKRVNIVAKYTLFYLLIGLPSLISAAVSREHKYYWTEIRANNMAKEFFGRSYILDEDNYPLHGKK